MVLLCSKMSQYVTALNDKGVLEVIILKMFPFDFQN
jgi:hypothetical protein